MSLMKNNNSSNNYNDTRKKQMFLLIRKETRAKKKKIAGKPLLLIPLFFDKHRAKKVFLVVFCRSLKRATLENNHYIFRHKGVCTPS